VVDVEDGGPGLLRAAADRVEAMAARTTGGTWTVAGLLASRPEVVAVTADGDSEHVAEARARTVEWITALSPALAGPLAAWLRAAAREPVDEHALAVARLLAGRPAPPASAPAPPAERISALYDAFDARDVDAVLAQFAPDVDWPDAMHGGRVLGHAAVGAYWLAQWAVIDLEVHPRRVRDLPDGRVEVLVEQVVRDRDGDLLSHAFVLHTYTFTGPLISRMDVGDPQDPAP
jgi:hypothetical protein